MVFVRDRRFAYRQQGALTAQLGRLSNRNLQQHRFRCMPGGTSVATIASFVTSVALHNGTGRGRLGSMPMRVLIVDDHPIVASGCRALLAGGGEIVLAEA